MSDEPGFALYVSGHEDACAARLKFVARCGGFKRLHLTGLASRAAEKPLSLETWIAWRAAEPR